MTGRADLSAVADLVAAGSTTASIAARLGIPDDLAEAMVDELDRLGLVRAGSVLATTCGSCAPSHVCHGCPLQAAPTR